MWLVLVMIAIVVLAAACRPPETQGGSAGGLVISVHTEAQPQLGTSPLRIVVERDGEVVTGAEVSVTGDMTHAGMVPVVREAAELEPGVFVADDFEFTMAGDWILTADVRLPDGGRATGEARTSVGGN